MNEWAPSHDDRAPSVRALLFDANGEDRPVEDPRGLDFGKLTNEELAWIDITADGREATEALMREVGLEPHLVAPLMDATSDALVMRKGWYAVRAVAPRWNEADGTLHGAPWLLVVGRNVVFTAHREPIAFLDKVVAHHDPASHIGDLDADTFAIALLDRMLTAYYAALDAFEMRLDQMEVEMFRGKVKEGYDAELGNLRRAASRFRQLLGAHRELFDALRRPDFRPEQDDLVQRRFRAVSDRYERTMDAVESARDLVAGSFDLLDTRLTQRTNDTIRLLTFVTVLLGTLAVIAGVLGMNFEARFFGTGTRGFWIAVGAMGGFVVAAIGLGRLRGWWK
ncbi:Magnesium and cobalt transport protein CorA [Lysobacter dokdonensis DS-58]|uniref:Magnesium and cobalt transport protein CorA n=1 Tax=Lysobacter dokdonensis DS-58 TaxID=1300345 RepID=A0A0A2WEN2_9GAMM|nr:CorA family divalent cation transporter [Lysobacter dokdonensis]KGQ18203.1 Magnesium and cobalt transport protein CorA [Lysobacter dokdonensis DS-58]